MLSLSLSLSLSLGMNRWKRCGCKVHLAVKNLMSWRLEREIQFSLCELVLVLRFKSLLIQSVSSAVKIFEKKSFLLLSWLMTRQVTWVKFLPNWAARTEGKVWRLVFGGRCHWLAHLKLETRVNLISSSPVWLTLGLCNFSFWLKRK